MAVQDLQRIEEKLDKATAGAVAISDHVGGIMFTNMAEVMEFSKLMSLGGTAVPKHLRGNPGGCLAITIQALEWRMSPFAVANKSYEVNDRMAYEAQLIHAVIEARAPLKGRLRDRYEGEGTDRLCIVTGHIKGEVDPLEYKSPPISKIKVKNSPLWTADPDQQLWYYSTRSWARKYCPDVLLGIYTEEELREGMGVEIARDVTPSVGSRLKGSKGQKGFQPENVSTALEHKLGQPLDTSVKEEKASPQQGEALANTAEQPHEQELALPIDVEAEIATKKSAVNECRTKDDLRDLVSITTQFLKDNKRTDLLNGFLSVASAREKKLEV